MKTILYRLAGVGKIREPLRSTLEREGIQVLDEGIGASVTFRNYRDPARGKRCTWNRRWFTGSIVLTRSRVIALGRNNPVINLPLTDERIRKLRFEEETKDLLLIAFDASLFRPECSGTLEYRFHTPQASTFLQALRSTSVS